MKLHPRPKSFETAFIAVPSPQAAVDLLSLAKEVSGGRVVAFVIIADIALQFTIRHKGTRHPLPPLALVRAGGTLRSGAVRDAGDPRTGAEQGLVNRWRHCAIGQQRDELWAIRELISESQKPEGGSIKHDISVAVSQVPRFLAEADAAVERFLPGCRFVVFAISATATSTTTSRSPSAWTSRPSSISGTR